MANQGYFFSRLEFAVLLLLKGTTTLYTFSLPEADGINEESLITSVCELIKMGFCNIEGNRLNLTEKAERVLEPLSSSSICARLKPGDNDWPEKLIYFGKRIAVLENSTYEDGIIRIQGMQYGEFWQWMEDVLPMRMAVAETEDDAWKLLGLNQEAMAEYGRLKNSSEKEVLEPFRLWMDQIKEDTNCKSLGSICIMRADGEKPGTHILLLDGLLSAWVLQQKEAADPITNTIKKILVIPDTNEFREQFLNDMRRKMQ